MSQRSPRSEGDSSSGEHPVARILTSVPSPAPLPAPVQPYEVIPVAVDNALHSGLTGRHRQTEDIVPEVILLPGMAGRPTTVQRTQEHLDAGKGKTDAAFLAEQEAPSNHIVAPSFGPMPEEVKLKKQADRSFRRNAAILGVLALVLAALFVGYMATR